MHIPLSEWAEKNFSKPPCTTTLSKWAKSGAITPKPFKLRKWMVDENARFVGEQAIPDRVSGRVADILRAA